MQRSLELTALIVFCLFPVAVGRADSNAPIKKDGLVRAVRLNGFTTEELVEKIDRRGVDFQVTAEIEQELLNAGARPELIDACRKNYRPPAGTPASPQSTPPPDAGNPAPSPDPPSATHATGPPLGSNEILTLLQSGIPSERIEKILGDRGVNFSLTPQVSQSLRGAGGTPSLIATIAEHLVGTPGVNPPKSSAIELNSQPSAPAAQPDNSVEYEDLIDKATAAIGERNMFEASRNAEEAVKLDPSKPGGYTLLGYVQLYGNHNYIAAEREMRRAIEHGGHATFRVYHDHTGVFSSYCDGSMFIGKDSVTFKANDGKHTFEARRADIKEVKANGFVGAMFAAFHLKVKDAAGKVKNYNFAPLGDTDGSLPDRQGPASPQSKAEQELILRLMLDNNKAAY